MERYEAYKDSGIEWIGEIPETWDIRRAKTAFTLRRSKGNDELVQLAATQSRGMIPQSLLESVVQVSEDADLTQFRTVHENDFVISLRSFQGGFEFSQYEGVCSPAYQVFFGDATITASFFKYLFKSDAFISKMNSLTVGIREGKNIQYQNFANSFLAFPPPAEQEAIADYLDAKTAEIDGLIMDCEREVELLQEYRKAVISEAVTKGLDPNASMRDSGIEWIGEIPSHWECSLVKRTFINRDSERIPIEASLREQTSGGLYPYYGASGIVDSIDDYIFDETLILIGEDGANLRLRNLPLVYVATGKYWVNNHAHILQPCDDVLLEYAACQLELVDLENYLTGSTQPKLTQDNLGIIPLVLPPIEEQEAITAALDVKTAEINALIEAKRSMADKLSEYRRSLISEAVTGKFKVPGI